MKTTTLFAFVSVVLSCVSAAYAGTIFGSGANTFEIEFVTIGDPGNAADTTGNPSNPPYPTGSVAQTYRIGQFEISEDMIDKANAETAGGANPLNITHDGRGANKPATSISWYEAARFVNWLNTSTGSTPAYKFDGGNHQLWEAGDAGFNPANLFRNSLAAYFLPSVDEWYKAAYYDPVADVYYDYPTGSDSVPDGIDFAGDLSFDAVFRDGGQNPQPNDITDVGLLSPYGTAGQGGNVFEWEETAFDLVNDSTPETFHTTRGGYWFNNSGLLTSLFRGGAVPETESFVIGFRVAGIPEQPFLLGDISVDGKVDIGDFTLWGDCFQDTSAACAGADLSGDGVIDIGDFTIWGDHFGETLGPSGIGAGVSAVPEPSTFLLFSIGVLALAAIGRCRRPPIATTRGCKRDRVGRATINVTLAADRRAIAKTTQ